MTLQLIQLLWVSILERLWFHQTCGELEEVKAVASEEVSEVGNLPPKRVVNSVKDNPRVSGMTKNTNKMPTSKTMACSMNR